MNNNNQPTPAEVAGQLEEARAEIERLQNEVRQWEKDFLDPGMAKNKTILLQGRIAERDKEIERLRAAIKAHYDKCLWVLDGLEMQGQWNNADYELWQAIGIDAEKGGEG